LDALSDVYDNVEQDDTTRVLMIGSAQKVLSAGLDLKEAQAFDMDDQMAIVRRLNQSFLKLYALSKPTVIAINGAAIAGGFFFVLGCDYRVASTRASVGLAEVRVGATLPAGPEAIAKAEISAGVLRRLLLGGQPLNAQAALTAGIVDEIAEPENVMDRALAVARDYAALPPKTYAIAKRQLRGDVVQAVETAMKNGANSPKGGWFTEETKSAMAAMLAR
jgi:enoyl-CoA hydratase